MFTQPCSDIQEVSQECLLNILIRNIDSEVYSSNQDLAPEKMDELANKMKERV